MTKAHIPNMFLGLLCATFGLWHWAAVNLAVSAIFAIATSGRK